MQAGRSTSARHLQRDSVPVRLLPRLKLWQRDKVFNAAGVSPREPHLARTEAVSGGRAPLRNSATFKVQLIKPSEAKDDAPCDKLLVYLPGTDGTGQAILPQIPGLHGLGYDVWCLYLPLDDRSDWEQLTTQLTLLLRQLLQQWRGDLPPAARQRRVDAPLPRITIVGESFGCCLALRVAASGAGPELLDRLVLLNPATSFNNSFSGFSSLIAATNLLSLFPRDWYAVAQTTLLPLLVDRDRVEETNQKLLQSMILMEPPASSQSFGFGAPPPRRPPPPPPAVAAAALGTDPAPPESANGAAAGGGGNGDGGGTLYYGPAAAANFRANLLRSGDPGDEVLRRVTTPVLLVTSARDRLLPSIVEGARLERALPNARRYMLPDSGHAAMLERGFSLAATMQATGFAADQVVLAATPGTGPGAAATERRRSKPQGTAGSASASASDGSPEQQTAASAPALTPASWSAYMLPESEAVGGAEPTSRWAENGNGLGATEQGRGPQAVPTPSGSYTSASAPLSEPSTLPWSSAAPHAASPASSSPPSNGSGPSLAFEWWRQRAAAVVGSATAGGEAAAPSGGKASGAGRGGGGEEELLAADVDSAFDEWCQKLTPWRDVVSPVVRGFEHLPPPGSPDFSRPMLFVGNHQKMGFYDTPLLVYELYVRGYRVRGLAHPGHWSGPFGRWFESFGSVKASPMAAFRLLRASEKVLLFPGGAKEVVKKRGQEYTLLWKESPDFVRLAAKCNALIVPFAAVGADDAYDVIMDTDEVIAHPLLGPLTTGLLSRVSSTLAPQESIFPITRLPVVGLPTPIPIPNLQRLYFQFAPPIDPRALGTDIHDPQQVQELYDGVKGTVMQCMAELLVVREADEDSQLGARLTKSLQRMVPMMGAAASTPSPPSQPPQ